VLLAKTEFTRAEWMQYMKAEGLPYPEGEGANGFHPVVNVSWEEVTTFCNWFSEATGRRWRLPTSAEWSIAVGEQKSEFPWEGAWPPPWDRGNYSVDPQGKQDRSEVGADGFRGTAAVGRFPANSLGFYDLGGNVWEFVSDESRRRGERIVRGASWGDHQLDSLRSRYLGSCSVTQRSESLGFRVAVESSAPAKGPASPEGGQPAK
jgi:formylglycine-generating enzyme required for sulfatase activity